MSEKISLDSSDKKAFNKDVPAKEFDRYILDI